MKTKVRIFLLVALMITLAVPLYNLSLRVVEGNFKNLGWKKLGALYTIDWIMPYLGRTGYSYGISVAPENVIIAKKGWLFAGDGRSSGKPLTNKREGIQPTRMAVLAQFVTWTSAWDQWLKQNGVQEFRIMVGPDKDSIYPEFLPDWVDPAKDQLTDILARSLSPNLYVNLYPPLLATKAEYAKKERPLNVYYPTDSHWNWLGAWAAMSALQENLSASQPQLKWLDPSLGQVAAVEQKPRFDINKFVYMDGILPDEEVHLEFHQQPRLKTEFFNFNTGQPLTMDDPNVYNVPHTPILMKTEEALNKKRVLWLHDSFGFAMMPYMRATFSEIVDIHPLYTTNEQIADLVKRFKPDYVFVTSVERYVFANQYSGIPPQ